MFFFGLSDLISFITFLFYSKNLDAFFASAAEFFVSQGAVSIVLPVLRVVRNAGDTDMDLWHPSLLLLNALELSQESLVCSCSLGMLEQVFNVTHQMLSRTLRF